MKTQLVEGAALVAEEECTEVEALAVIPAVVHTPWTSLTDAT